MLLVGSWHEILLSVITAIVGIIAIACAAEGWFLRQSFWYERIVLFIGAVLMVMPGLMTDIVGIVLLAAVYMYQKSFRTSYLKETIA